MKKVRLSELSDQVRRFLEDVKSSGSIAVFDDNGELQCGVTPYAKASPDEKRQAIRWLENEIWPKTAAAMEAAGVTEDDIMRDLLEDD